MLKNKQTLKMYKVGTLEIPLLSVPSLGQLSSLLRGSGINLFHILTEVFHAYASKCIFPYFTHMVYLALYSHFITFIRNNSTSRK